jgi:hypothetical protein
VLLLTYAKFEEPPTIGDVGRAGTFGEVDVCQPVHLWHTLIGGRIEERMKGVRDIPLKTLELPRKTGFFLKGSSDV